MLKWIVLLTFVLNVIWAGEISEKGIALLKQKKYEEALSTFKTIETAEREQLTSLIGQLYCTVALGRFDQIDPMIAKIDLELREAINCDAPPPSTPQTKEHHQISYECRQHVREVANQIRETVEKLVRETVPGFFQKIKILRQLYPYVDALERTGLDCCQNNYPWQCCTNPLLEQLEAWNSFGITPQM